MFRSLVPNLKLSASEKNINAVLGRIYSKIAKRIGIPSFGRRPGRLFLVVSIHPYKKLWKP
jgi:hypothetical protein